MNVQTENGFTRIANELYEAIMKLPLGGYERRVLDAIIRKTYGYKKKEDYIALSQITELTGISKSHASEKLRNLMNKNIVTKIGNKLAINKDFSTWKVPEIRKGGKFPKLGKVVPEIGNEKFPKMALQKIKDNITKETIDKSIGETPKKEVFGNQEIERILSDFKKLTGHIPSDRKPRQVAQNIRQIVNSFIKKNNSLFLELRAQELTPDYIFEKFYRNFQLKKYIEGLEKLETVKLKLKVYLDDIEQKLTQEKSRKEEYAIQAN